MDKKAVAMLARELFKIRIASSNEGVAEDDGIHKMSIQGISSYEDAVIETWYREALKTAEIILTLEERYLAGTLEK